MMGPLRETKETIRQQRIGQNINQRDRILEKEKGRGEKKKRKKVE